MGRNGNLNGNGLRALRLEYMRIQDDLEVARKALEVAHSKTRKRRLRGKVHNLQRRAGDLVRKITELKYTKGGETKI